MGSAPDSAAHCWLAAAVGSDLLHLGGRADGRHEDPRGDLQRHRRVRDGGAVIAARGRDDAGLRDRSRQEIRECAARLEGAGALRQFQLQRDAVSWHAEIGAVDVDDGRAADVGRDDGVRPLDVGAGDGDGRDGHARHVDTATRAFRSARGKN
jgi:hypothetical protein